MNGNRSEQLASSDRLALTVDRAKLRAVYTNLSRLASCTELPVSNGGYTAAIT